MRCAPRTLGRVASPLSAAVLAAVPAYAATKNWDTTIVSGNWSVPTNWLPTGVPSTSDNVFLTQSDAINRTVTLDTSSGPLGNFIIAATGAGHMTFNQTANSFNAGSEIVGDLFSGFAGTGICRQSSGTNNITGALGLNLGNAVGSLGTYSLSGTGLLTTVGPEYIGQSGTGIFIQSGGTNVVTASTTFNVAGSAGSVGTYSLSGNGLLTVGGGEFVGLSGSGGYMQTAGTNNGGSLALGYNTGSTGNYTLSGSSRLSIGVSETIGSSGIGNLTQSLGFNFISGTVSLFLGYISSGSGTYTLNGPGVMQTSGNEYIGYSGLGNFDLIGVINMSDHVALVNIAKFHGPSLGDALPPLHTNWICTGNAITLLTSVQESGSLANVVFAAGLLVRQRRGGQKDIAGSAVSAAGGE